MCLCVCVCASVSVSVCVCVCACASCMQAARASYEAEDAAFKEQMASLGAALCGKKKSPPLPACLAHTHARTSGYERACATENHA